MQLELTDRKQTQKQRVLNALKDRGNRGIHNYELSNDMNILCYTKRLSELYADGHDIHKQYKGHGSFLYILRPQADAMED